MKAVYSIRDCCGDEVERVEIELSAGFTDPSDFPAESEALKITGYDGLPRCVKCGDLPYRARYAGRPIPPIADAMVSIVGLNRDHLVETLETLLTYLRDAPEYVNLVNCDEDGGCIE